MNRLRLHISPCPNDTFMFDAMVNGRIDCEGLAFDVEFYDIEELNALAQQGIADISKISCALLPAITKSYALLDAGAALGRGNGPLLVRRKGDDGALHHVIVPGLHTTANALMQRLFPEVECRTPMLFSEVAAAVERGEADAGVLIHEGRFVYERRNLMLVADLGLEWEARTNLPLPLGGIVIKRDFDPALREKVEQVLRRSIEYAFANPMASREWVKAHAQEMEDDVIDKHIALFVNDFSLSLGDEGRAAMQRLTTLDDF